MELSPYAISLAGIVAGGVVFIFVWGRKKRRRRSSPSTLPPSSSTALFQGVNFLLANDPDGAIEAFTRAVRLDSDTVETYITLGNLFRTKGEIDKAIRIRQSILLRPHLDQKTKLRALYELGLDYKQGGFLQRAISTFEEVIRLNPTEKGAYEQLSSLYETARDWRQAFELRQKITKLSKSDDRAALAHLRTEMAKEEKLAGRLDVAEAHLKKALELDGACVAARLQLGEVYWLRTKKKKAFKTWMTLAKLAPEWAHLIFAYLPAAEENQENEGEVVDFLYRMMAAELDAPAALALARSFLERQFAQEGVEMLRRALQQDPTLTAARRLLGQHLLAAGRTEEALEEYRQLLAHLEPRAMQYQCQFCGFESDEVHWQCPGCRKWDMVRPTSTTRDR